MPLGCLSRFSAAEPPAARVVGALPDLPAGGDSFLPAAAGCCPASTARDWPRLVRRPLSAGGRLLVPRGVEDPRGVLVAPLVAAGFDARGDGFRAAPPVAWAADIFTGMLAASGAANDEAPPAASALAALFEAAVSAEDFAPSGLLLLLLPRALVGCFKFCFVPRGVRPLFGALPRALFMAGGRQQPCGRHAAVPRDARSASKVGRAKPGWMKVVGQEIDAISNRRKNRRFPEKHRRP